MRLSRYLLPLAFLALSNQAQALCQVGTTGSCTVNGKHGTRECFSFGWGPCETEDGGGGMSGTGTVSPRYYVLTVVYAPPGTHGATKSSVSYGQGSSTGTSTSVSHSFKQEYSISATTQIGPDASNLSIGASFGYNRDTSNSQALEIKKNANTTIAQDGPGNDGIDHNYDLIYLWLNPKLDVAISGSSVHWTFDNATDADIQYLYVGWLKNPAQMPPGVAQALQRNGITAADYPGILAADPLANGGGMAAPRYVSLHFSFPYEPPYAQGDSIPTYTFAVDNTTTATNTNTSAEDYSVGLTVGGSTGFLDIYKETVQTSSKWTWSDSRSQGSSTGNTQSASVTIGGPSFGYSGPTEMLAYYDTIYRTFAFAPLNSRLTVLRGLVKGTAPAGKLVTATANGVTYRTITDAKGEYRFHEPMTGPVTLKIGGLVKKFPRLPQGNLAPNLLVQ